MAIEQPPKRRLMLGTLASCAAFMLAGCSGSGSPENPNQLVIGQISAGASQTPLFVAVDRGFFKKRGLDVSLQSLSGGTPSAMASVATGNVNLLVGSSPEIIEYLGKGVISGKIIGELADQNYDIITSPDVPSLAALKGATIGISGENGADQIYLKATLAKVGVNPSDVTFITSGSTANRLVALSTGTIKAVAVANANREEAGRAGKLMLKSEDGTLSLPSAMVFATDATLKSSRPKLSLILAALADATAWMRDHRDEAANICAKASGASVRACQGSIAVNLDPARAGPFTWSSTYAVNREGIDSALAVMGQMVPETARLKIADVADFTVAQSEAAAPTKP